MNIYHLATSGLPSLNLSSSLISAKSVRKLCSGQSLIEQPLAYQLRWTIGFAFGSFFQSDLILQLEPSDILDDDSFMEARF
jgi:hypothetical protein